ncbi:2-keto-4-pentenoate hydratase [Pedococcus sp. 5OH_020]|uniref:2-keto-4-pentenoate hydratase n=1 Tax=Pedococcus sp. 5OH_020 TaxID=2989814 RepID=UPI0022E9A4CD|nr:fumarylacetoacetate hydrolase family protein [Pedococcus sp. 5OH_020]
MTTAAQRDDERVSVATVAADRLRRAAETGVPCAPVRDVLGDRNVALAYRTQRMLTQRRLAEGGRIVGRKIGLTSPAVQQQLGVAQPDFGVLFGDMDASGAAPVSTATLLQPKIEAEVAFVLGSDLDSDHLDLDAVRSSVDYAVAALEIVDSRVAGWDIRITDTVADNASSALYVLGEDRVTLDRFEPREVVMTMTVDGSVASEGTGEACLGDPLEALLWLARTSRELGDPLRAGQLVLSGALGPMVAVRAGSSVRAEVSGIGSVSVTFAGEDEQ